MLCERALALYSLNDAAGKQNSSPVLAFMMHVHPHVPLEDGVFLGDLQTKPFLQH